MQANLTPAEVGSPRCQKLPELVGTWSRDIGIAHACRAVLVSMSAARMVSVTKPAAGDEVTVTLAAFNPLAGMVADTFDDGFILDLSDISIDDMIELALFARQTGMARQHEERAHYRVIPKQKLARVDMQNGRQTFSRIIDVSRAGIAVETLLLETGSSVDVGGRSGKVVRTWDHGAAIQFDKVISSDAFTDEISFR